MRGPAGGLVGLRNMDLQGFGGVYLGREMGVRLVWEGFEGSAVELDKLED